MQTFLIKAICLGILSFLSFSAMSQDSKVQTVKSPNHRVALFELYTSEGCSSCPPADKFLTKLKNNGIDEKEVIPIAFHVTYWDYIGWTDRFAKKQYDQRQRDSAHKRRSRTVYTPQFVLIGQDYRGTSRFNQSIHSITSQPAIVDLTLSTIKNNKPNASNLVVELTADISKLDDKSIELYLAVVENDLRSEVIDGENEGENLLHDYVVRKLIGPIRSEKVNADINQVIAKETIDINEVWKQKDLSVVAFAQSALTGEILQAVKIAY